MSLSEQIEITCPSCGQRQQMTLWRSINVTRDPRLRDRLMDGSLARFQCKKCRHAAPVDSSLLYHDMKRGFMVFQLNAEERREILDTPGFGADPAAVHPLLRDAVAGARLRMVDTRNQLIEKVHLFEAGLDDRLVEGAKAFVRARLPEEIREQAELLRDPRSRGAAGDRMDFSVFLPDGRSANLPMEDAGELLEGLRAYLASEPPPEGWAVVDRAFGEKLLMRWFATQQGR